MQNSSPFWVRWLCVGFIIAGSQSVIADDADKLLADAEAMATAFEDPELSEEKKTELRKKIRGLLTQSFEKRQADQIAQIESLTQKLDAIRKRFEARKKLAQRIIDRKLEDLVSGVKADWNDPPNGETPAFDTIEVGDVLGVWIEGVLPFNPKDQVPNPPPVYVTASGLPATGFPIAVQSDGKIALPLISPVPVAGLSVRQAEAAVRNIYVEKDILLQDHARPIISIIRRASEGARMENEQPLVPIGAPARATGNWSPSPSGPTPLKPGAFMTGQDAERPYSAAQEIEEVDFEKAVSPALDAASLQRYYKSLVDISEAHAQKELRRIRESKPWELSNDEHKIRSSLRAIESQARKNELAVSKQRREVDRLGDEVARVERTLRQTENMVRLGAASSIELNRQESEAARVQASLEDARDELKIVLQAFVDWEEDYGHLWKLDAGS
ncbi:MAG: polysaccharide biosynthesis/export family protein [Planctomycetota bacterium]